jgi:hypothetical protein
LQTKLEKLTAQKNAIEQKKQALLIEQLTIEMEMNQERLMKLEITTLPTGSGFPILSVISNSTWNN